MKVIKNHHEGVDTFFIGNVCIFYGKCFTKENAIHIFHEFKLPLMAQLEILNNMPQEDWSLPADVDALRILAKSNHTPAHVLVNLANSDDLGVKTLVAVNPNTPLESTVLKLLQTTNTEVRRYVAKHSNSCIVSGLLAVDDDQYVRVAAKANSAFIKEIESTRFNANKLRLEWKQAVEDGTYTFDEAVAKFGKPDKEGWRLPSSEEARERERSLLGAEFDSEPWPWCWTSTEANERMAFYVKYVVGAQTYFWKTFDFHVRLVREVKANMSTH